MASVSVKEAISNVFSNLDLGRGILGSIRHEFYDDHPGAFSYRSVQSMLRHFQWPRGYRSMGNYPDDTTTAWSNILQGVTHDDHHWFITQADSGGANFFDLFHIHLPGEQACTLWKIPVEIDLGDDLDDDSLPDGVIKTGKPGGDEFEDYNHFGSPDYYNRLVYIALEAKGFSPDPKVLVYCAETLAFRAAADLVRQGNGHAPWCAVNPLTGLLYSSPASLNAHNGYLYIYEQDWQEDGDGNCQLTLNCLGWFELFGEDGSPITINNVQAGTFSSSGQLYLLIDTRDENAGIHGFDMVSGRRVFRRHITYGTGSPITGGNQELEGITLWDLEPGIAPHISGQLHILHRDPDLAPDDVSFMHFEEAW